MPIFTLDTNPVTETDGKFTINLPDDLAVEATKFNTLNTQFETVNTNANTFKSQLEAFNGVKPEDIALLQTNLDAYKQKGDPETLSLDLATAKQTIETMKQAGETTAQTVAKLTSFQNNTVIGGEINGVMSELIGAKSKDYTEVFKMWIGEFNLNSEGKPVTKEGFTVKQHMEAKLKDPKFAFLIPASNGGSAESLSGGRTAKGTQALYDEQIAIVKDKTKSPRDRNKAQLLSMKLASELQKNK